jgi:hypothetical protein
MKNKLVLLATVLSLAGNQVNAKKEKKLTSRNTTVSLFGNYSFGNYDFTMKEGLLETRNSFLKFGLSISKDYYFRFLPENSYLSFGLRYKGAAAYIKSHTYLQDFAPDSYNDVTLYYDNLSVPIYVGKKIVSYGGVKLFDVFGGVSLGVCQIASATNHSTFYSFQHEVGMTFPDFLDIGPFKFYSSLDLGFRFTPPGLRHLSVGGVVAYDLNKTAPLSNSGAFIDYTINTVDNYGYTFSRRFVNILINVNYTFGRNWK